MGKNLRENIKGELKEFKNFAIKDNVITLAVGVIIGVAFKDLVDSLVQNIFTPPIGYLTSDLDFSQLYITLGKERYDTLDLALEANAVVLQYGQVLNAFITFLITAFVLFLIVRALNKATVKEEKRVAKTTKKCFYCMTDIPLKAKRCPNCTSDLR